MNQQERIIQSAEEHIVCVSRNGRGWGKNFRTGFECAVQYTLENLWVSVDEALPEYEETVLVTDGTDIWLTERTLKEWTDSLGFSEHESYSFERITHWMPIPTLPIAPDDLPF